MIVKSGKKYKLMSKDGKKHLGTFSSRGEARRREMQIEYFKHKEK